MKNTNFNWSMFRKLIALALMGLMVISCGDKKNKVADTTSNPFGFTGNAGLPAEQTSQIASVINGIQCDYHGAAQTDNNRKRYQFRANTGAQQGSNTTLYTSWAQGAISQQQVYKTFIGRSYEGDVMIIYQTASTYEMDLYLCPARSNTTGTWFIGGDAQISNFTFSGYNLDTDVNCGRGSIDSGSFSFSSNRAGNVGKLISKVCWQ